MFLCLRISLSWGLMLRCPLLQLGAIAERLGGVGKILHGYNGLQPSVDAVRWMNFDEAHVQTIINFPLTEISFFGQEIPPEPTKTDTMETEENSSTVAPAGSEGEKDKEGADKGQAAAAGELQGKEAQGRLPTP